MSTSWIITIAVVFGVLTIAGYVCGWNAYDGYSSFDNDHLFVASVVLEVAAAIVLVAGDLFAVTHHRYINHWFMGAQIFWALITVAAEVFWYNEM